MRSVATVSAAIVLSFALGCADEGGGDDRPSVEPTLGFAQTVKTMIADIKNAADEDARAAAIDSFVENYAEYASQPLGANKATYDSIATAAQELKSLKDGGAGDAELTEKVDAMVELANQLPGEAAE